MNIETITIDTIQANLCICMGETSTLQFPQKPKNMQNYPYTHTTPIT